VIDADAAEQAGAIDSHVDPGRAGAPRGLVELLAQGALARQRYAVVLPDEDLQYVVRLIHSYDGIGYTRERAKTLIESAKTHLSGFSDCPAKEAMLRLADYIVSRNH